MHAAKIRIHSKISLKETSVLKLSEKFPCLGSDINDRLLLISC